MKKEIIKRKDLIELFKKGIIYKGDEDINLISNLIIINPNEEDTYYQEIAELIFKSILYYVLFKDEIKTLNRCKEIAQYDISKIK